ncbi:septal ring lytic transglycosylase RlpA family protein [Occallatibacter savannae]|uniref:septal ring lytic transglycosylase RlpA family protein n=1 Tax=Occallatibacter savannae TaxID=1002691 RepID=UPI000D69583E|nr:SPOR domain-containing protein [Occallatibacter savannae]
MRLLIPPSTSRFRFLTGLLVVAIFAAGCGHKKTRATPRATAPPVYVPPPSTPTRRPVPEPPARGSIPVTRVPEGGISAEDKEFILSHRPIYSEEGKATWYTAARGRKAANGQLFSDEALTAAHRTLPMGSLIVVTNLKTRQASAMRISDRGPFVTTAILDLTKASAQSIGIWPGSAQVRIDVYETPKPMDIGGRWCVQIGPFTSEHKAIRFKEKLIDEYAGSKVIEFPGERSYWVRIRPAGDDREQAEEMARRLRPEEGVAYLTRLD